MNWMVWTVVVVVGLGALFWALVAETCRLEDDTADRVDDARQERAALGRAVTASRQLPSLAERSLLEVPRPGECVRCFGPLDPGRYSICTGCWQETP